MKAQEIIYGDTVPEGQTVEGDILLTGQEVVIAGKVNGNVFVAGNSVELRETGEINGSLVVVGQIVRINGTITGGAYAAGLHVVLQPDGHLERDLYMAGVGVQTLFGARIERDLYSVAVLQGEFFGYIGRDPHIIDGPLGIFNSVVRSLDLGISEVEFYFDTTQPSVKEEPAPSSLIPVRARQSLSAAPGFEGKGFDWGNWGLRILRRWFSLFVVGLFVLWLWCQPFEESTQFLETNPLVLLLIGLIVMILMVALILIAFVIVVPLIFAIGLGMGYLGLWGLSLIFWTLVFSSLSVLVLAIWTTIVFGSKLIVVYWAVRWLFRKFVPAAAGYKLLVILVGSILFVLLRSVPYLGDLLINPLVMITGLGAAGWLLYHKSRGTLDDVMVVPLELASTGKVARSKKTSN
ncbi:MAG: polymer-forming cytoskeletal protein [Anaerolineales bacterium]|nr:polymer-forming cytoskeletal protein [Anaerolineales bacterium]